MRIMAVDYGSVRTGLAVSDPTETLATPAGVIKEYVYERLVERVASEAQRLEAKEIIVGYPLRLDGTRGSKGELCSQFADDLQALVGAEIPVKLWDERRTTMQAASYLDEANYYGRKRRQVIDQVAATVILESYLAYRKSTGIQGESLPLGGGSEAEPSRS